MEIISFVILWIISGLVGGLLMGFGLGEPAKKFIPFGIVFGLASLLVGVIWALLGIGERWANR